MRGIWQEDVQYWAGLIRENNCASSLVVRVKWKAKLLYLEFSHVDHTEYGSLTAF